MSVHVKRWTCYAENDAPSPHNMVETPCCKGFRDGETYAKGLPNGLPKRLPNGLSNEAFGSSGDSFTT